MNSNVFALFLTTQEALKYFPSTGGSIINISSGASVQPGPFTSLYGATKAATDILIKFFARELGSRKILVNTIAPGVTATEGFEKQGLFDNDEAIEAIQQATALSRIGQPEDIASVAVYLSSDAAVLITGARIPVSGGLF